MKLPRQLKFLFLALAFVAMLAGIASADEAPRFVLHTSADKDHAGELKQIGAGWKVMLLEDDEFARGNAEDLIPPRKSRCQPPASEHPSWPMATHCPVSSSS